MKITWLLIILFLVCRSGYSIGVSADLKVIRDYFNKPDSAIILANELLEKSENASNYFGLVKANLYLGFLHEQQSPGRAVLYYLEGMRFCTKANPDSIIKDIIWLRRNLSNIFRKYESNDLATKYNLEAIEIAESQNDKHQIFNLKLNQGLIYQNDKDFERAAIYLNEALNLNLEDAFNNRIINQLGLVYLESGELTKAKEYFNRLVSLPEDQKLYSAKALHNLGEIFYAEDSTHNAIENLRKAIAIKVSIDNIDYYSLFNSYLILGRYLLEVGLLEEAEHYLKKAESISSHADFDPKSFEVYKNLSSLYFNTNKSEIGNYYSEKYFNKVQSFIETQREIQRKDKEYNFELITKRYFDELEEQDRIASIVFISKLSSGSLIVLLILVITYYQVRKLALRKSIKKELEALKIID
ncbi:MAG: tetratricopeptide repeat protein [Bacteroidota bacterium]